MSTLRFGTCSWKFPSWKGIVYSRATGINYLSEYAKRFTTVEIDQWFWALFDTDSIALPKTETVAEYLDSVPPEFSFTIKAPNAVTLTHFYSKGGQRGSGPNPYFLSPALFAAFLEKLEPLKPQISSVMLQFEYLNRQKMSGPAEFADRLGAFFDAIGTDWPISVEIRNPNYLGPPYFALLAERGVAAVFCHGYYMPPVMDVYKRPFVELAGPGIIRLLGPDRGGIEKATGKKWDRIVEPKDEELPAIADTIIDMLDSRDVVVNVNNHYEGSAPLTIEKLERLVDERRERFSQIR
jgi:uncharacterized protein YecE (DUF72 family)